MGVIIITGELGSGKTTLLKSILRYFNNKNISVIVNDLASINFDVCMINKKNIDVKTVSSGCVCCTKSNELIDAIKTAKSKKILLETTGIAELRPIIETFKQNKINIDLIITVIDSLKFEKANIFNLKNSNIIVLSKIDLIGSKALAKAKAYLKKNSVGKIIPSIKGNVPKSFIVNPKKIKFTTQKIKKPLKHKNTAIVFVSPKQVKKEKLIKLLSKYKRAKGHAIINSKGYHINAVEGVVELSTEKVKDTRIAIIDSLNNLERLNIFIRMLFMQKKFFISFKQIWFFIKQLE